MTRRRPAARGILGRLGACVRFEALKLAMGKLPWVTLAITILTALGTGWMSGRDDDPAHSYRLYGAMLENALPLAAFFLLIMGCLSVNEELASGAMRAVLLRPVSRGDIAAAKAVLLAVFALVVWGVVVVVSWGWVATHGGFDAVYVDVEGLDPYLKLDAATIAGLSRKLSLSTLPALICAPLFGLLISLVVDAAGSAVAVGVFLFLAMKTVGAGFEAAAAWMYPTYIDRPIELLLELAQGIETHRQLAGELGPTSGAVVVPSVMAIAFGLGAVGLFRSKEISC